MTNDAVAKSAIAKNAYARKIAKSAATAKAIIAKNAKSITNSATAKVVAAIIIGMNTGWTGSIAIPDVAIKNVGDTDAVIDLLIIKKCANDEECPLHWHIALPAYLLILLL